MAAPDSAPAPAAPERSEPRHWLRLVAIWFVLALVGDLLIWFALYPHLPPGRMTDMAAGQQFDIAVLSITAWPVMSFVLLYFVYALVVWRRRPGDDEDGPPIHGNTRGGVAIQVGWILGTAAIVLWVFAFGTYELIVPAGAGGGEGPNPIWRLSGAITTSWTPGSNDMLQVQVIGQQWWWTYRYPQFGGMESTQLYLPNDTPIEFHVTSLDVIHSFWAYQLGVKADANPNVDNVAYTRPRQLGSFVVRCNELCGIWHGAMFNYGKVVTQAQFLSWANGVRAKEQADGLLAALPPYALTYDPTVIPQLGKTLTVLAGITGANGYYYSGAQAGTPGPPVSP